MSALAGRMATGASTIARVWVLTRRDGLVLGFTDHDGPLVVDGVSCRASSGLTARTLETGTGLAVDNSEAAGVLSDDAISEDDLRAGRWDGAGVVIRLVDWSEPALTEIVFRGTLGEVSFGAGAVSVELRGLTEGLNVPRGRVYHGRCDAVLGDARCAQDMTGPGMRETLTVREVVDARVLIVDGADAYAPDWFARGQLTVTDGAAVDLVERVKRDAPIAGGRRLELWAPLGALPAAGDTLAVEAGCDKTVGTCANRFDNLLNFRGFPHLPGDDWLTTHPSAGLRR